MAQTPFREFLANNIVLADGAMGTYLLAQGIDFEQSLAGLILSHPNLVADVHRAYVAAGARLIETNTFAANGAKLERYGLARRTAEVNEKAAALARAAGGADIFIAGSVGPLGALVEPFGQLAADEARAFFREQMAGLLAGGVDLVAIETMSSAAEATLALGVWRDLSDLPALVSLTFLPDGTTKFGDELTASLDTLLDAGADVVGLNCNLGPKETYDLITEQLLPNLTREGWFLSAMPNAGYPTHVADRAVYTATPAYFGEYARLFAELGVNLLGGCCGTTPAHVAAMADALRGMKPARRPARPPRPAPPAPPRHRAATTAAAGSFAEKIGKQFVVTVEVDPPRGADYSRALDGAAQLRDVGVDAVNVADNPLARVRMSSVALAHIIHEELGLEPILHFTCRDRNLLGLQSELIGAAALGIGVVLALTGDPSEVGDYPKAKSVFDLDSTGLVRLVNKLRAGADLAGKAIGDPFAMKVGVALNPGKAELEREYERLREKVAAGADFAMTQPFYDAGIWFRFLERFGEPPVPVLLGILPFKNFRHAQFLHYEVPGIEVPPAALARMEAAAARGKEAEHAEGIAIARELVAEVRASCQGIYIMPPFGRFDMVADILA